MIHEFKRLRESVPNRIREDKRIILTYMKVALGTYMRTRMGKFSNHTIIPCCVEPGDIIGDDESDTTTGCFCKSSSNGRTSQMSKSSLTEFMSKNHKSQIMDSVTDLVCLIQDSPFRILRVSCAFSVCARKPSLRLLERDLL